VAAHRHFVVRDGTKLHMSDDHWRRVKQLFEVAVEQPPSERSAFVLAIVAGDDTLRRELEALLEADEAAAEITKRWPAASESLLAELRLGRPATGADEATFSADENVGSFRIVGLLGTGGMGEVFRAHDRTLNRVVALKVLPRAYELDLDRLARLRREAQALAALNHPNIAAIYGFEESGRRQALILELVEGVTLASRIREGPLPLVEALTLARQIAGALEAAHQKGIVHRDLKPANIKVTPAGVVKVLDFGLAKATADSAPTRASQAPRVPGETHVGVIVGTAAYMSPEQGRGHEVDTRADIWAFGCVLFELLAGRQAFEADSASDSIAKVLDGEPAWAQLPKHTPARVQQLLRRCLTKDPRGRPQTIAEVRVAIEALLARRASWRTRAAVAATVSVAVAVGAYAWFVKRPTIASRSEWVQLTNLDSVTQPALSPDGRMLAFIRGGESFVGPGQVYVKLLPDGEAVALTNDTLPKMSPVFSPDGSRVAYTVNVGNSWDTWEVPTIRGAPRPWLQNASGLTWTGASELLFSEVKAGQHMAIVRSSDGRLDSHDVYVPPHKGGMAHRSYVSPDKQWVLLAEMDENTAWVACRVGSIDGSASRPVGPTARCTDAAWSPDGRWMYFSADAGDGFHVWRQRFPDGQAEQVTSGPTEEQGLALSADGGSLITSVGLVQRSVWYHDASGDRQISLEGYAYFPLLSADGRKVVFRLTQGIGSGQSPSELWFVDLNSEQRRRLFPGKLVTGYDLSRDDRVVAAIAEGESQSGLWLAWLDGREPPRRIPDAVGDIPKFGRVGEIVYRRSGTLYRIREDGTGRERLVDIATNVVGTVSPDGEWLTALGSRDSAMTLFSTSGQAPRPLLWSSQISRLRWSLDGRQAYLSVQSAQQSAFASGRTYVIPLTRGAALPPVPPGGFRTEADIAAMPGVEVLPHGDIAIGPSPSIYAFSRVTTTRNLYRIPLQ
jgi:eukaryotic-like serine/threonine-protein kinase